MYANGRVNLQFCYQLSYFTRVCILNGKIIKAEEVFSLSQTISFHCQAKFFSHENGNKFMFLCAEA